MKKAIGVLGTMSGAGKSTLALLLIRYMKKYMHLDVAPFKGQNMSLNSKITPDGKEMASAQYYQALAAEVIPSPIYNPILLKPGAPTSSFLIIEGKPAGTIGSKNWISKDREKLWEIIRKNLDRVMKKHDYIVIEGAGSPAEINLKRYDITNFRPVLYTGASAILVADIDRGGSFAQIVGTMELLTPEERNHIKAFVLNKFRGDPSLLKEGIEYLQNRYGIPTIVMPYIRHNLPEEDALKNTRSLALNRKDEDIVVAILKLPHISNHDDFDPLIGNVPIIFTDKKEDIENADMVIIPGSRKVVTDLMYLRENQLEDAIISAHRKGGYIIGICGGFQMLTEEIRDPYGIEAPPGTYKGIGLIKGSTTFQKEKITKVSKGRVNRDIPHIGNIEINGYEIHHGIYEGEDTQYFIRLSDGRKDGYYNNRIIGTYIHGLFHNKNFTETFLNTIRREKGKVERALHYTSPLEETDRVLEKVKSEIERLVSILL